MRLRTTVILLVILIVIAAYFFLIEERQRVREEATRETGRNLFAYGPAEVRALLLVNPAGDSILMQRRLDGWAITAPVKTDGAKPTIDAMLSQIAPGTKLEEFTDVERLSDFGLAEPFASVILFPTDTLGPDTLHAGDKTPTSSRSYVRIGGRRSVYITRDLTRNVLNKTLYHLRDKNFVPFNDRAVHGITVHDGERQLSLSRDGSHWRIGAAGPRADRAIVDGYLARLTDAIIYDFASEDLDELTSFGLRAPERTITLGMEGDEVMVSFGDLQDGKVHVVRSGLDKVLLIEDRLLEIFDWTASDLRAMNLAFFEPARVSTIRLESADTSIVIEEAGDAWRHLGTGAGAIERIRVNALLSRLASATFTEIVREPLTPSTFVLERGSIIITLTDAAGGIVDLIKLYVNKDGLEFGASRTADAAGLLERNALSDIESLLEDTDLGP